MSKMADTKILEKDRIRFRASVGQDENMKQVSERMKSGNF